MSLVSVGSLQSTGSALSVQGRRSFLTAGSYRPAWTRGALTALCCTGSIVAVAGALALHARSRR
jgi:hypothetical protein